ncbi:ABC transporter substrate-binding protein [Streptomyces monticola]|uniref:ABC transporter substrate-binding protein n=1 Tax=Streptomyces monticola TaxID=2666263 RepID=A0ABW2JTD9_9ACTN
MVTGPTVPPPPAQGQPPVPPRAPRPKWWYVKWAVPAAVLVAYAVYFLAGSSWGTQDYWFDRCADGVWEEGPDDECVGVTDGAYTFDGSLKDVTRLIHEENEAVEESGKPWVSVAYVQPVTRGSRGKEDESARQELEGAYLAQYELNRTEEGGPGDEPQIKLLLANPGAGARQWEPLADRLIGMKDDDEHRLVAVAGFGPSLDTTKLAVDKLRKAKLPLLGATSTADGLTDEGEIGFFRVVSPNRGEAAAAARHLRERQRQKGGYRVAVVRDRNGQDIYSRSLHTGFSGAADKHGLKLEDLGLDYDSGAPATANAFASIAERVCREKPDALYFAGRGRELREFITAMAAWGQRCRTTVLTGDDAIGMFSDVEEDSARRDRFAKRWRLSNVTVLFTALAHPDLWRGGYPTGEDGDPIPEFSTRYTQQTGRGPEQLDDGEALVVHDALFVAGSAIRDAGPRTVSSGAVLQLLLTVKQGNEVKGLSGPIRFGDSGDPVDKPLPLVELKPSGEHAFREVLRP